ncbi:putative glycerophosphodiester phosphodiesterase, protein kinase RLK-Pelle-LRK10L-2 family [Rosa chinensis]|uniref:Putative glycerophosphodiester phosphodiesterase, protein kinase RLK-Pelle-LRK10L-2 family n=1 Tax=Rosa chinensis TaxID=74649 RepID=A0A2P6SAT4_ROSCH|nr:putative glycerophosphodiester phosphodiesterase, protein kinase RLK-Pelle-LRK10L-2 family [Rosa chinensis]
MWIQGVSVCLGFLERTDRALSFFFSPLSLSKVGMLQDDKMCSLMILKFNMQPNHAVKSLQQKSNSLFLYELQEIVHARAEIFIHGGTRLVEKKKKDIAALVKKLKRKEKQNHLKIEIFLEDYRALKPSRYSYADIKRITNQFKDKLSQGAYGTVYKGKLSSKCFVAVKVLNSTKGDGEEFVNEVGTMGHIHHVNVLQDIALGIARGIEYLHQGCDQRILHFDIKPHNILLDHNFTRKISDFGLAKLCSKDQSIVSMTTARGTMGYIAPEVFSRNFGNVSYKSDVYSYGMVLLEMVGGKKNISSTTENTTEVYYPEWIYNLLEEGEDLRIHVGEEGDAKIAKRLAIVGLWCI